MAYVPEISLGGLYRSAKTRSNALESFSSASDVAYQENVLAAIESLEQCRMIARQLALFSPNETLEDIASSDIPYTSGGYTEKMIKLMRLLAIYS